MVTGLGISCFYHDAAAAIIRDGVLVAAAEEERFTRKKHDNNFPINAINFCLQTANVKTKELDYIVFYEKPFIKFERVLMTTLNTFPKSWRVFREAMLSWLTEKLWIRDLIRDNLELEGENKIFFIEHHLSHAAGAFFCSPFEEAAIITVDGVGEWATATIGVGKNNDITILKEIKFPHSLGLLYSTFTAFLGFKVNDGEYKVMGMAPYGKPKYKDDIYRLIKLHEDGSFSLNMDYFCYHHSAEKTFNSNFEKLFGEPRSPKDSENLESHYADIAASIQEVTEEILLKMVNYIYRETGLKNLCLAGGVALNSKANGRILKETPFKDIYIQPAAGDAGGAIGAAFYIYHALFKKPKGFTLTHAYYGKAYTEEEIKKFLDTNHISYVHIEDERKLLETVVDHLVSGEVVGWVHGRFEWGPRALGSRSILADPRRPEMKDIVNRKIKFREPFRPFAPAVIAERAEEFFDLQDATRHYPARFMLYVVPVKLDKRDLIPAVTHVDGSARPQIVFKEDNPRYYHLIEKFGEATGVPVLLNTSFNLRGEPIVNTPENAYNTFIKSEMDLLVMERFIVRKGIK